MRFLNKLIGAFKGTFLIEWMTLTAITLLAIVFSFGLESLPYTVLPALSLTLLDLKLVDWLLKH